MPGVMGKLGEERLLGTAVALAERVQGVDVSEEPARAVMNESRARPRCPIQLKVARKLTIVVGLARLA
jgi:hypothetical protein